MADSEKRAYPLMSLKNWWTLREKFHATIPGKVTATYLSPVLGLSEKSAQNNVIPSLRKVGLIDDDGKPTKLATRWRDDAQYSSVCEEMRKTVYPQELLDFAPDAKADRSQVTSWFANHTSTGISAAQKMAAFYLMLAAADPSRSRSKAPSPSSTQTPKPTTSKKPAGKRARIANDADRGRADRQSGSSTSRAPSLHLNVQIHLSPEATPEQIDKIFESMGKHLKNL